MTGSEKTVVPDGALAGAVVILVAIVLLGLSLNQETW